MKPARLAPNTPIEYLCIASGRWISGVFLRRQPRRGPTPAVNWVQFPCYAGPDHDGTCQISDYDLSRRGRIARGGAATATATAGGENDE